MFWPFRRKPRLDPNLEAFHNELINSVYGRMYGGADIAGDFRLMVNSEPQRGRRALFMLLTWCGEYEDPPTDADELREYAGRRRVAGKIKAALFADLSNPEAVKEMNTDVREP